MDYLKDKFADLEKAIATWKEALIMPKTDISRDASIQRFEFTSELLWKTVKVYLKEQEGVICASPKTCFRESRAILQISDGEIETAIKMCDDRNLSVHTYSEEMADVIYEKLPEYLAIAKLIAKKIKAKAKL